ncbi:PREDICTED: uncharacterized mitochondrial protein AtMg00810-like [Brassica oleracea var. oleracea]|uniref:uncharacterized mitochondrial protein AtMg00810-like n=1 Tax=Brassica oleracea var. oleracea TaxID=109376 RepID=UPI0006A706B3|nr:PREDICTED: uncharacterized mitochondrial protein AtMg00810-like [Brassica oleracea var. oleracea]
MTREVEMSMIGELNYFMGLQIKQMEEEILSRKALMQSCYKDDNGVKVDEKLYRAMIGSLPYLTASRPDICYIVGVCSRYQASPCVSHLNALKQIIKYVNGMIRQEAYTTKEAHQEDVSFLGTTWYPGIAKSKTVCRCQQERLSTFLLEVAAHNPCG